MKRSIIAAVIVVVALINAARSADRPFTFRLLAMADGIAGEATEAGFQSPYWDHAHFGSNTYEASDGQRLSVTYMQLRSEEEAKRYFDWNLLKSAEKVITQKDKLDTRGTVVGHRAEVLLKSGRGKYAVMWTRGATFRAVFAQDLEHAVALEKQYGRGRVR